MKLRFNSVSTRLFLAIFATCILLVVIMHQGVRLSFQHGFTDYIKENDQQRAELIADALAEQYDETGSWRFLIRNERAFFHILRSIEHHQRTLPPTKPKGWRSYFWVYDSQDRRILGRDVPLPDDVIRQPVISSNGKTVGWVIASSGDGISNEIDRRFDDQQMLTSWFIAGLSLIVALIATFFLARGF